MKDQDKQFPWFHFLLIRNSVHVTDEEANRLRDQWSRNALIISTTCAPLVTVIIDGMPSVVKHPQRTELHKIAEDTARSGRTLDERACDFAQFVGRVLGGVGRGGVECCEREVFLSGCVLVGTDLDCGLMGIQRWKSSGLFMSRGLAILEVSVWFSCAV